ncbi:hypothetical protein L484_009723 [Morus notabilis]|uniref:BHLH domain-containing protein n=1 Tax=Morus notabilis TaxID=981085 RepID=W9QCV4_9ROSA|nr:transcription factor UPBEAT1 [Morus notabilis]EXB28564.1 hypothetical protein L484_009723 [Morus notabilis]
MGISQYSLLEVPLDELKSNSIIQGNEDQHGNSNIIGSSSLWNQRLKRRVVSRSSVHMTPRSKRPKRIVMKRRRLGASRRRANGVVRRVRTLKRLIPNSESVGTLDGLFRETADYILCLQMRVRVMQIVVKVLSGSDED